MTAPRNAILAAALLLQLIWLGLRAFQAPAPAASFVRGLLLEGLVPGKILRLEIAPGSDSEKGVALVREAEASAWRVPDLFDYRADGDKVDRALRDLAGLEIASVVSSTPHHHVDFKVAESEFERRIRLEGAGEPVELLFGSSGPAGTVHVRRAGEDAVYAVRGYSSWRFAERTKDWIDKVYFTAPRERIARIAIDNESGSFGLERAGEEGWVLIGGGGARLPAEVDQLDSLLRAMSRVSLSELVGRIDGEEVAFGDPVAEIRLALAAPRAELKTGSAGEPDAGEDGGADTSRFEIEETRTLRVALAPGESERYWLHAEGSEFVAEVGRWTIRELLDAVVQDFQAAEEETDETLEIVEVDDTDGSDETDETREDDAESEEGETQPGR